MRIVREDVKQASNKLNNLLVSDIPADQRTGAASPAKISNAIVPVWFPAFP